MIYNKITKTPIFYMGNKEKLIKNGLTDLFPSNINTFYDLFGGSGIVSMNTDAQSYVLNDISKHIVALIKYFRAHDAHEIIYEIERLIEYYKLPTFSTDTRIYKGDREIYKERYKSLRDDYNKFRDIKLLYLLNIFSNSHMMRFNSNGEFNMPFGNGYFTEQTKMAIKSHAYAKINTISNFDFRHYCANSFLENDFVYLDPPYYNTTATYNENGGWTEQDENDLLVYCEQLNNANVKWGMSNVFLCKGITNDHLIKWCNKHGWNVYVFDNFTYVACGKGNSNATEVFITNYNNTKLM